MYLMLVDMVRHRLRTGQAPEHPIGLGVNRPLAVNIAIWKDEESCFRFGPNDPPSENAADAA